MSPATWIAKNPARVLIAGLSLTLLALWPASRLHLETDLAALLPSGDPAAQDYRLFLDTFGGFEKVFLLLRPLDSSAVDEGDLLAAAEQLADVLAASAEVAEARSGLQPEDEKFFLRYVVRRAPLLLPEDLLDELSKRLRDDEVRAQAASLRAQIHSPTGAAKISLLRHDPLELSLDLPFLAAAGLDLPVDPVSGGFLAEATDTEPAVSMVMLTPASSEVDPASGRRLVSELDRAWARVRGDRPTNAHIEVLAVGGPLYAVQDETIIRRDLEATVAGSALGCALLLLLAFRGPRIPFATLTGLAMALLWAAGALGLFVGSLTAPGLGFAAVLVGLGIDYGIHGGVRFRQAILQGFSRADALAATYRQAGPAIVTSATTTALAFAVLGLAHFRPLKELGTVVAFGIVAILVGSATVGAALITFRLTTRSSPAASAEPEHVRGKERKGSSEAAGLVWRGLDAFVSFIVDAALRHRALVLLLAAALTAVTAWGATKLELDTDMGSLRPTDHPALEAERVLSGRFAVGLDTTTLVIRGDDLSQTLERADAAARVINEAVPGAEVVSPTEWLTAPGSSRQRLERLAELPFSRAADALEDALRQQNLAPTAFSDGIEALRAFGRGEDPGAPGPDAFPSGLAELLRFREDGAWAALRLRLPDGTWPDGPPAEVLRRLEEASPGVGTASVIRLGASLKVVAGRDLEVLFTAALAVVAVVVLVSFRGHPLRSLVAMTPVLLGSLWTLGLWGALGYRIDLLGLAVIPILLGIGIDDGLHAVHGSEREGLVASIRHAGLAMTLTTLTTSIGFASLLLSSLPGLRTGGFLVAGGVAACLVATLVVLPALATYGKKGG
ncbi:MAG: MMPL family transporter [Thermoanaerobaculia bacterium]|nr:MMPL family transporter [Thermoanaerobaculia bacterium]